MCVSCVFAVLWVFSFLFEFVIALMFGIAGGQSTLRGSILGLSGDGSPSSHLCEQEGAALSNTWPSFHHM